MRTLAGLIVFSASLLPLTAQWPNRPTDGVPRTPDGKPNLSAPAPRAPDGKPDLSGVWRIHKSYLLNAMPDLKPDDIQPWAAAIYQRSAENFRNDTDGINCLPPGPKTSLSVGSPVKIVQTPKLVVLLYEYQTLFRQVFTDGRGLPEDPNPTWMGYSVGHWDGDTLVVTTAGFNDRTSLDLGGHPHSEALRMTERFHRRDAGHIDLQVTIDDPKAYNRQWTLPVDLDLMADGELIEYICEDHSKPHLVGKREEEFHISKAVLAQYVGTYAASPTATPVSVTLEGDRLMIDPGGMGKIPLVAMSENTFSMEGNVVEFLKDANGQVTKVVQHWTEGDRTATRRK
ncbi:MAG TPA: hypothetical protein VKT49_19380 [Bryobacteraceae bacterium]|nr:hypothetical protein [Bryobacteraceae bacterium]